MFLLLAMVIIGGRQSLVGCVVGAIALRLLRELLVDYPTYAQVGYGSVVVAHGGVRPDRPGRPARHSGTRRCCAGRRGRPRRRCAQLRAVQPYEPGPISRPRRSVLRVERHQHAFPGAEGPATTSR